MKRFISLTILFSSLFVAAIGQCDQKATLTSKFGRFIQGDSRQSEMPINAIIKIDNEKILLILSMGSQSMTVTNTIKKREICEWKEYLKNGQSIYKVTSDKGDGIAEDSVIKINGKDGKTTIYFGSDPDEKGGIELNISEITIDK